eukprot:15352274-Heterocapsa_arctica.AAC.1
MGINNNKFGACVRNLKLVSSSDVVQTYQRSARNILVIARIPEARSTTLQKHYKPLTTFKAIYTCTCTPVGRTDYNM